MAALHPEALAAALRALLIWSEGGQAADLDQAALLLDQASSELSPTVDAALPARIRLYQAFVAEQRGDAGVLASMVAQGRVDEDGYHYVFASERRQTLIHYHLLQECQANLTSLQEALDRWAADHDGGYPAELAALTPQYLPRVPTSAATGEPYQQVYLTSDDGHSYSLDCPNHHALDGTTLHISGRNGRERNLWEDGDVEQRHKILHMATGSFVQTGRLEIFLEPLVEAAGLEPGMVVADIGSGPGMFSFPFAERVAPGGAIHAVDINPSVVDYVSFVAARHPELSVQAHLSQVTDVGLPEHSLDAAFVIQTYHANLDQGRPDDPQIYASTVRPFLQSIARALEPDGILVIQDGAKKIPLAMLVQQVERAGFEKVQAQEGWDQQFIAVFRLAD